MFFPIKIDTSALSREFSLSKREVDGLIGFTVKRITAQIAKNWETEAKNNLQKTRFDYIQGLYVGEEGPLVGIVGLKGWLPNAIEQGLQPFDQKIGFSKSSKAIRKNNSWYLTIPFRYATAGSVAESSVFSGTLPEEIQEIYNEENVKPVQIGSFFLEKNTPMKNVPEEFSKPGRREAIPESRAFQEYQHKTSMFEGLIKSELKNNSQYVTFRRVSDKSDPNSWIHSGIEARHFAEKAVNNPNINFEIQKSIDKYLQSLGFGG